MIERKSIGLAIVGSGRIGGLRAQLAAGHPAESCYLVVRGALEVFTRTQTLERRVAIAGPGELVGFMAVINAAPRANNARVREACCLLDIPAAAFLGIYNGASGTTVSLQHAIHRSLMRSIARTNTQLTRLIRDRKSVV